MEYPKLRPIEAFSYNAPGKEGVCLRDSSNLTDMMVIVPYHVIEIIRLFDGQHSILDIQTAYARRHGEILLREKIEGIISRLDEAMLLENERFRLFLNNLKDSFRLFRNRRNRSLDRK